jgi:hypothetical protein
MYLQAITIKPERLAIILEAVSFFLVTIDLFGRDRIERLQQKVEARIGRVKDEDIQQRVDAWLDLSSERVNRMRDFIFSLLLISIVVAIGYLLRIWGMSWVILGIFLAYGLSIGIGIRKAANFSLSRLMHFFVKGSEKAFDWSFAVILYLFERLKLEGLMIIIGAILFATSKTISYVYAR